MNNLVDFNSIVFVGSDGEEIEMDIVEGVVEINTNKIKAEAVREALSYVDSKLDATRQDEWKWQLESYANKLEEGEL